MNQFFLRTAGAVIATSDPDPTHGARNYFGLMWSGISVGAHAFQVNDIRQRSGGLAGQYQGIPEGANFWDLGFWDGKPRPAGGCMLILPPETLLNTFARDQIAARMESILPVGTLPVVRYYDAAGNESL